MGEPEFRDLVWEEVDGELAGFRAAFRVGSSWWPYSVSWRDFVIREAIRRGAPAAVSRIWELADGPASPGLTEGPDWQRVGGSTEGAVAAMFEVAQANIDVNGLRQRLDSVAIGREAYRTCYGSVRWRVEPPGERVEDRWLGAQDRDLACSVLVPTAADRFVGGSVLVGSVSPERSRLIVDWDHADPSTGSYRELLAAVGRRHLSFEATSRRTDAHPSSTVRVGTLHANGDLDIDDLARLLEWAPQFRGERTWLSGAERFMRPELETQIDGLEWHPADAPVPAMPGLAISAAVEQLPIPRPRRVAWNGVLYQRYQLLGVESRYNNGAARTYLVDTGTEVLPVASDFWPRSRPDIQASRPSPHPEGPT